MVGVCGQRGEGTVTASAFSGWQEFYLIGDDGFGSEICVVRFEVTRTGEAPPGCSDPAADIECSWTHRVQYDDSEVVVDEDGACANSELKFDAARIDSLDGSEVAYGFVSEYAGHASVLMTHDSAAGTWEPFAAATWDPDTGTFRFDHRDGFCGY
jgi:hypothetical protein